MAPLANQLRQVLRTYTTRWTFVGAVIIFAIVAGIGLVATFISSTSQGAAPSMYRVWVLIGFPSMFATQGLVAQSKRHFAHPRSRLLPSFAPSHLIVPFSLTLAIGVLIPVSGSVAWSLPALGLVTYALSVMALAAWASNNMTPTWTVLVLIVWFSPLVQVGQAFWGFLEPASARNYLWLVLAADWGAIAAFGWRLTQLTEEMDDYFGVIDASPLDSSPRAERSRRNQFRFLSRRWHLTGYLSDLWHDRLGRRPLSPAQRSAYGFDSLPIAVQTLFIVSMLVVFGWFYKSVGLFGGPDGANVGAASGSSQWALVLLISVGFPPLMVGYLQPLRRWPRFQMELLRPASREDFVKDLFVTIVRHAGVMLAILIGGLAIGFAAPLSRVLVAQSPSLPAQAAAVATGLVVLFASQILCLGVAVWLLTVLRGWVGYLLLTMVISLLTVPVALSVRFHRTLAGWPGVLLIAALFGLIAWTWRSAYRRWLRLELGATG